MNSSQSVATVAMLLALFTAGCGSTPSTNSELTAAPVTVVVAPATATVQLGGVLQFISTTGPSAANQAVNWSVSGAGCTGSACGAIDATGKYTPPASLPSPATITITASSVADSTKTATATVTIVNPPVISSFSVSPASLDFGNQTVNTTSQPKALVVMNTGGIAQPVSARMNGANFADFAQNNDCPSMLAVGATCTFSVTFTPTGAGVRIAFLAIDGTFDEEALVPLTGSGK
jgi:hypothetical protein